MDPLKFSPTKKVGKSSNDIPLMISSSNTNTPPVFRPRAKYQGPGIARSAFKFSKNWDKSKSQTSLLKIKCLPIVIKDLEFNFNFSNQLIQQYILWCFFYTHIKPMHVYSFFFALEILFTSTSIFQNPEVSFIHFYVRSTCKTKLSIYYIMVCLCNKL